MYPMPWQLHLSRWSVVVQVSTECARPARHNSGKRGIAQRLGVLDLPMVYVASRSRSPRVQGGGRGVAAAGAGRHRSRRGARPAVGAPGRSRVPGGVLLAAVGLYDARLRFTLHVDQLWLSRSHMWQVAIEPSCCWPHASSAAQLELSCHDRHVSDGTLRVEVLLEIPCRCGARWRWPSTACCTTTSPQRQPSRRRWGVLPMQVRPTGCARLHRSRAATDDTHRLGDS